ncbi:AraC family transcriptional regulator [Aporhodopirellula aestuarii]|uniref:DNA-binding transcriptional regulator n=1 Tax=Aporhodopirellula aestuarii TaxID=2950107 RepID=A0ABT0U0T7_9BACT|nr:DNA-binding transcriptional regulator [Aporhodopirellula aestuarii]MCM2370103.1 DNA-binding transcriptional regulator [Aporhodopirellula aestuarii]
MKPKVALIVETSSVYGRDLLSGIVRHMRMHDQWSVFLEQRDLQLDPPQWLSTWQGDGIISRVTTPTFVEAIKRTGVPMVELTDRFGASQFPGVRSDDAAIGRAGAMHLIERGFTKFAFCGFAGEAWSKRRQDAFAAVIRAHSSHECEVYNSPWTGPAALNWEDEQQRLVDWLNGIKPPVAVMACSDIRGLHLIDACSRVDLAVPEEVAVIGVDNDELLCRICSPTLSSVIPNAEEVGFRAAELLARLMKGESVEPVGEPIPPLGVAARQSTDVVAIDDSNIAAALRFMRENACRGVTVEEVIENTAISRSTLERQVRKYLGRTPQEEIRHVQIKRVRELLQTTDLPADRIAALCGFAHPEYMHVVFKRVMGVTPGEFRRNSKL